MFYFEGKTKNILWTVGKLQEYTYSYTLHFNMKIYMCVNYVIDNISSCTAKVTVYILYMVCYKSA